MTSLLEVLESLGILVVGLLARLLVAVVAVAALAAPILAVLAVWRRLGRSPQPAGDPEIARLPWREGLYHAPGHAWLARRRGRRGRVGIDGLAARLFPDASRVELPRVGADLRRGEAAARLHCGDRTAAVLSPVTGRVTAVNAALRKDPALPSKDPYGRGWLYAVALASDEPALLHDGEARAWFRREAERLAHWLESELGLAAADGGELVRPAGALMTGRQWAALTRAFLGGSGASDEAGAPSV
jgi:glycine cleavage system H protein